MAVCGCVLACVAFCVLIVVQVKGEIFYLSFRYSLTSQYTSFVAISDKTPADAAEVSAVVCFVRSQFLFAFLFY